MSETRLNKEFSERDIQRMRNIVSGNTAERTRVQAGYQKQSLNMARAIYGKKTVKHGL
jgi:hypothetical protein